LSLRASRANLLAATTGGDDNSRELDASVT